MKLCISRYLFLKNATLIAVWCGTFGTCEQHIRHYSLSLWSESYLNTLPEHAYSMTLNKLSKLLEFGFCLLYNSGQGIISKIT